MQATRVETLQEKLMKLMTTNPSTEQLEEAVGMIEGLKPKGEWDNMASLGANLNSLQQFMRDMDGKATEEEEALAIANAVLAAEGQEGEEDGDEAGGAPADDAPAAPEPKADGSQAGGSQAGDANEEEETLPVPPELADKLKTLRGKKKYLEEIRELEMQVRSLQEQAAAGFPPEVEPPEVFPDGEEGDAAAGDEAQPEADPA